MANEVNASGAEARLKALMQRLRDQIPEHLRVVGESLAQQASERAPSPDEEYDVMMRGDGDNAGVDLIGSPSSQGYGSGRTRFVKPLGEYLQPFILQDVHQDGLMVGVGEIALLNDISNYFWVNVDGTEYLSDPEVPFWEGWEDGAPGIIVSAHGAYPLQPDNQLHREPPLMTMEKDIPKMQMFGGVDVETTANTILRPAIREIAQSVQ